MKIYQVLILTIIISCINNIASGQDTFTLETYDGKSLPAQVLHPKNKAHKTLLFINGSTPYDEKGSIGPGWTDQGKIIAQKHEFYTRFINTMVNKGYSVATMAKRSFVYPTELPRPNYTDLSLDIFYFISELKNRGVIRDEKDLIIVGYSEGSLVATKVLAMLKSQLHACILLGSGSIPVNYKDLSVENYYQTDWLKKNKQWSDDQILTEISQKGSLQDSLRNMDENKFETYFKNSKPFGFGYAPWESYYIDKEWPLYNSVPNILYANVPVLICVGENDAAMPPLSARNTYNDLLKNGFKKGALRIIKDEVHQYNKYDVFAIMDTWLKTEFTSTEFTLTNTDSIAIENYRLSKELINTINALSWEGNQEKKVKECYQKALKSKYMDSESWFGLGIRLVADKLYDEAFTAFSEAEDENFIVNFAVLTWMGHLKDLNNQRAEAIKYYHQALAQFPGFPVQHDHWNIYIDKSWIEDRIENPFKGTN